MVIYFLFWNCIYMFSYNIYLNIRVKKGNLLIWEYWISLLFGYFLRISKNKEKIISYNNIGFVIGKRGKEKFFYDSGDRFIFEYDLIEVLERKYRKLIY